jgi:hypothetical protein
MLDADKGNVHQLCESEKTMLDADKGNVHQLCESEKSIFVAWHGTGLLQFLNCCR